MKYYVLDETDLQLIHNVMAEFPELPTLELQEVERGYLDWNDWDPPHAKIEFFPDEIGGLYRVVT